MLNEMLEYLAANEEYIGWTVWAAGPSKSTQIILDILEKRIIILLVVWGTASPCCGPTVGSLEPGAITSEGKPKFGF